MFLKPHREVDDWEKSDLWRSASEIPGVSVDPNVLDAFFAGHDEIVRFHIECVDVE